MHEIIFSSPHSAPQKLLALKANLHTHTPVSDGTIPTGRLLELYAENGYDVIALTDHEKLNDLSNIDPHGMTLIPGMEIHPTSHRGFPWHILALNIPDNFPEQFPDDPQWVVNTVNNAGGIAFAAHPHWSGFNSSDVMRLKNIAGIEVCTSSCRYIGREFNMQLWDETLEAGQRYYALATDDTHAMRDFGHNWTVICAESRESRDVVKALKQGSFYSSQGPEIYKLSYDGTTFEAEFSPCTTAILVCCRTAGYTVMVPDPDGPGTTKTVTEMKLDISGFSDDGFFRCQIADEYGRMAWSNPFYKGK